ncbi:MAG: hypothetical protein ACLU0O_05100 [Collinsella sp.]
MAKITERAMRGELDFKQTLEERVGCLPAWMSVFERTFERVTFTPARWSLCARRTARAGRSAW